MKNKTTAALLAFFLGGFGAQYFYLGKVGKGLVCLLFFWTFIPAFIALYHFIKFLTITDEAFNAEYNQLPANAGYMLPSTERHPAAIATAPTATSFAQQPAKQLTSTTDELEKLFALKEKGAITEEEYTLKKARLLA